MLPQIEELQFKKSVDEDLPKIGKSFLFDFKKGDFNLRDGRLVEVSNLDALIVWIKKILRTEKYRYKVYEREDKNEYGVALEDLIVGNNFPQSFVEAELKREIAQALTKHPMIQSLSEWKIEKKNPLLEISFKVNLKNGDSFKHEFTPLMFESKHANKTWDMISNLTWEKIAANTWEEVSTI